MTSFNAEIAYKSSSLPVRTMKMENRVDHQPHRAKYNTIPQLERTLMFISSFIRAYLSAKYDTELRIKERLDKIMENLWFTFVHRKIKQEYFTAIERKTCFLLYEPTNRISNLAQQSLFEDQRIRNSRLQNIFL